MLSARAIRLLGVASAALTVALVTGRARAQPAATAELVVEAPASCEGATELGQAVNTSLSRTAVVVRGGSVLARVLIPSRGARGWSATVTLRGRDGALLGERVLDAAGGSCAELFETLTLVLAMAIDAPELRARLFVPAARRPPRERSFGLRAVAGPSTSLGLLPAPSVAARLGVMLELRRVLSVELEALGYVPSHAVRDGRGAELSAWAVGLAVCRQLVGSRRVSVSPCLHATAGTLHASGLGLDLTRAPTRFFGTVGLGLDLAVRIRGPLLVGGELGAAVPLRRIAFVYEQPDGSSTEVFRMAPVGGFAHVFIGLQTP